MIPISFSLLTWASWSILMLPSQQRTLSSRFGWCWSSTGTWIRGVNCLTCVLTHFLSIEIWKMRWIYASVGWSSLYATYPIRSALDKDQSTSGGVCGGGANWGKSACKTWASQIPNPQLPNANPFDERQHIVSYVFEPWTSCSEVAPKRHLSSACTSRLNHLQHRPTRNEK